MKDSVYVLNTGERVEVDRLEWQHASSFTPLTGKLLPDQVGLHLLSLGRPPAVADMATGTGVWLRDLGQILPPDAQLHGYDYDTSKFPSPDQLPSNITLAWGNALKPLPDHFHGQYDLVHIRLLKYGLKADQWRTVAENLSLLLRSGGYIVWEEAGYPGYTCVPITETFQKLISLDARYAASVGRDVLSPLNLVKHIQDAGFVNCSQTSFNSLGGNREVQKAGAECVITGVGKAIKGVVVDHGGFEWAKTVDDVEEVTKRLREDVESGHCLVGYVMYWTTGQKP